VHRTQETAKEQKLCFDYVLQNQVFNLPGFKFRDSNQLNLIQFSIQPQIFYLAYTNEQHAGSMNDTSLDVPSSLAESDIYRYCLPHFGIYTGCDDYRLHAAKIHWLVCVIANVVATIVTLFGAFVPRAILLKEKPNTFYWLAIFFSVSSSRKSVKIVLMSNITDSCFMQFFRFVVVCFTLITPFLLRYILCLSLWRATGYCLQWPIYCLIGSCLLIYHCFIYHKLTYFRLLQA
jgi:hypothetical protein